MNGASEQPSSTWAYWVESTSRLQSVCLHSSNVRVHSLTCMYTAGGIIEYGSYKIALHSIGGAFGLMFFLVFFFMPETAFRREGAVNIDTGEKVTLAN